MNETAPGRRLFFALWPDEATRLAIHRSARTAARKCGGRPVPPENYHLTLAFLGHQPAERFDAIVAAGRSVAGRVYGPALEIVLDRFRHWSRPSAFLMAPTQNPELLQMLANELWNALEAIGVERDRRALLPHVTICRKVQKEPDVGAPDPVHWSVRGFVLVESVTDPAGARYDVVAQFGTVGD